LENSNHISQEEFERIERYLIGEMPEAERLAFEQEMAADGSLRQYVKEIKIILEEVETTNLRHTLDRFHEEIAATKTVPLSLQSKKLAWIPWAVAASLILALGLWVLVGGGRSANERLFTTYFEPDPGLVTAMGVSDQYEFDRGMVDYKMAQYQAAIERWEKLLQQKPKNDTLNYFLGASYLASEQSDMAAAYFQTALESQNSIFADDAWWYLGLTWLKQGEIDKAKDALQRSQKPEAKRLMEELDKK
jgi:tetratricopeptide (TPR) repeat protein